MKKSELVSIIREVIRSEIKGNIKKQVESAVQKQLTEIFINKEREALFDEEYSLTENSPAPTSSQPKRNQKLVKYVSDPLLNNILNETRGLPSDAGDYETFGGGVFTSDRMAELTGLRGKVGGDDETKRNIAAAHTLKTAGVSSEDVPEAITNALTRDYRALVKKFNKK